MASRAGSTTTRTVLTAACAENRGERLGYTAIKARAVHLPERAIGTFVRHIPEGTIVHPHHYE
ncbi:hypothetical protein CsSME_00049021 [Camellia sinensis var. sinensis]